jgi:hypothetical protein
MNLAERIKQPTFDGGSAWYVYCRAKDTAEARQCEGYEYYNVGNDTPKCKHYSWLTGMCGKYQPNK